MRKRQAVNRVLAFFLICLIMPLMESGKNKVIEIAGRAILLLFYANLLHNHGNTFLTQHKLSSLLYIGMESFIIALVLFRAPPVRFSVSPWDWFIAIAGTLSPILIQPTTNPDNIIGLALQILGIIITFAGVISLNRSFGIVPAERDIKTKGMYKFVRHPLYLGYLMTNIGVVANHFTTMNCLYVILGTLIQLIRILREEKFLTQNADYVGYAKTTRWRLLPFIW